MSDILHCCPTCIVYQHMQITCNFIAHLAFVNTKLCIQISYETKQNVPGPCESVEEIEQHDIIIMDPNTINVNML